MAHQALVRGSIAAVAALALSTGLGALTLPTAVAADGPADAEVVFPAGVRPLPLTEDLQSAGEGGYLHYQEGHSVRQWTDLASGESRDVPRADPENIHSGLSAVQTVTPRAVQVENLTTGAKTSIDLPLGYRWMPLFNPTVTLAIEHFRDPDNPQILHLLRKTDAGTTDQVIDGLPAGTISPYADAQDARGAVFTVRVSATESHRFLVDFAQGTVQEVFAGRTGTGSVVLGTDQVLGYAPGERDVYTVPRATPGATPVRTTLPEPPAGSPPFAKFGTVGDWVVFNRNLSPEMHDYQPGDRLEAIPIGGGEVKTLLRYTSDSLTHGPDGSVVVAGGSGPRDWAIRKVTAEPGAEPVVSTLRVLPPVTAAVEGLSLGGGRLQLISLADGSPLKGLYSYDLAPAGSPVAGERRLDYRLLNEYPSLVSRGDGHSAYLSGNGVVSPLATDRLQANDLPASGTSLVSASEQYFVANASNGRQYVGDFENPGTNGIVLTRNITGAALRGKTLWKAGTVAGTVDSYDLKAKTTSAAVNIGSGCVPQELQVVSHWLYWNCEPANPAAKAGVWDLTAGKNVAVVQGEALLGDGFVVRRDSAAGKLFLTDLGTATTTELASVAANVGDDRQRTWTVDAYGGHVAYVDAGKLVHIKPVTIPRSPLTSLDARIGGDVDLASAEESVNTWHGTWQLSRPAASWSLTVRNVRGAVVATRAGTDRSGTRLSTGWDGKDTAGRTVPNGSYSWTLTAQPADGTGPALVVSGATRLRGSTPVLRDYDGDGRPDLFGRNAATPTDVRMHMGANGGTYGGAVITGGWPADSLLIPAGDLNGDHVNDLLVRTSAGELRRYGSPNPAAGYQTLTAGWQVYNTLMAAGDLNGDGKFDIVGRDATGVMWRHDGDGKGGFLAARTRISAGWQGYTWLGTPGDLTGDGIPELLGRDAAGVMWRFDGNGTGGFLVPVKLTGGWQGYNMILGVGDLNGDGRNDVIGRDASGFLWRYDGTAQGSFTATGVKIGSGYNMYRTIG
ncbi:FG-GAP-like repeat-containing protein [Streptomyces sp. NPDC006733]|uniref:FG-GAP-like repeat-containing protein n=1 Tax=Streptomyces sp. NPDC006733 TaxID=3155460 RepID=UPI0033C4C747